MGLINNIIFNIYSIVIILIIYFFAFKYLRKNSLSDKFYMLILNTTIVMLLIDILSKFDGNSSIIYVVFNHIGNFMLFLMSPVLPSLWVVYVHYLVFRDEREPKNYFILFVVLI